MVVKPMLAFDVSSDAGTAYEAETVLARGASGEGTATRAPPWRPAPGATRPDARRKVSECGRSDATPVPPVESSEATRQHDVLARTVAAEVVPRLVLAHRVPGLAGAQAGWSAGRVADARRAALPMARVTAREVVGFARLAIARDAHAADDAGVLAEELRSRGVSLERLCLDLCAPAARRLGRLWAEDRLSYTEVTLGLWRMRALLRGLSPVFCAQTDPARGGPRRALVVPVPGADHTLGSDMVAAFLRLSGWEVCNAPLASAADLAARVRQGGFTVVGLSVGRTEDLRPLATLVASVRRAAAPARIGVLVGGPAVAGDPVLAMNAGADAAASDAAGAVAQAEGVLAMLAARA